MFLLLALSRYISAGYGEMFVKHLRKSLFLINLMAEELISKTILTYFIVKIRFAESPRDIEKDNK